MNAAAQTTERSGAALYSRAAVARDTLSVESRSVDVVASTEALDAHGTILRSNWDLARYQANPVVLYAHDQREIPIGLASNVRVEDGQLRATLTFSTEDLSPLAEQVWKNVQAQVIRGVSVGFWPSTVRFEVEEGVEVVALDDLELWEISMVPVPSNPEALASMRARAIAQRSPPTDDAEPDEEEETEPEYELGERVEALVNHMPGMKGMTGEIAIVRDGMPFYGVQFDGENTIHRWLAEDEIKPAGATRARARPRLSRSSESIPPVPDPFPAPIHQPAPGAKETQSMSEQFLQSLIRALGLPQGATEADIIARATASHECEVQIVTITGVASTAEAIGAVRGQSGSAAELKKVREELEKTRGERDAQNFETQLQRGINENKLTTAEATMYRGLFDAAGPQGRAADVVAELKGFIDITPRRHQQRVAQPPPNLGNGGAPLEHNGVAYRDLKPTQRAALSRENPELYRLMKDEWEAAGRPPAKSAA